MILEPTFQMPAQLSTHAAEVDEVYYFIYWVSVALFIAIGGTALYFVWRYRRKPGVKADPTGHNMRLEAAWTIAPVFVLVIMFHWGFKSYLSLAVAPPDAMEIRVRGFQWGWDFEYPNGAHSPTLEVPVHKPIKVVMSSADVVHSFFIPAFRIKRDLVPGMYTSIWFEANEVGQTDLQCAEYCGGRGVGDQASGHWSMSAKVNILTEEVFEKFLKESVGPKAGEDLATWGERLHVEKKCSTCHSVDGSKNNGPTWKGLWGHKQLVTVANVAGLVASKQEWAVATGTPGLYECDANENYVRESILEPQAKIVQGFPPVMPTYKGIIQDKEIDAIIAYMKTLK